MGALIAATAGLRAVIVITGAFLLPGWVWLSLTGMGRIWPTLQRWCLAIGLSVAFYPVLFYFARELLPGFGLGPVKFLIMFVLLAGLLVFLQRKTWREQFTFDRLELFGLLIFVMTMLTRFWAAQNNPIPAWSDSLHHVLITRLTVESGALPFTLAPYEPVPLNMYHLGLYALTGLVAPLAHIPEHTAVLWVSQALNGLNVLGAYLVLDRLVGRRAALLGAAVVGLFSQMPAFYVNWGRFTQVASQALIFIAWIVTWEAVRAWREGGWKARRSYLVGVSLGAAMLNAATFLLHFRVAAFYIPLLLISLVWEFSCALREKNTRRFILGVSLVGLASLVLVSPALYRAMQAYVSVTESTPVKSSAALAVDPYYSFPWQAFFSVGVHPWLFALTAAAVAVALLAKNRLAWVILIWTGIMLLEGMAYLLGVPALNFTNMGAVIIALYLPAALLIGIGAEEALRRVPARWQRASEGYFLVAVLAAGLLFINSRVNQLEKFRFFVTDQDVAAMNWINENTPQDAVFAINTYFWLPYAMHGTDGGYWIPYFTRRKITTGVMISNLGSKAYYQELQRVSRLVEGLEQDLSGLDELRAAGVDYIYIGANGDFSGRGLNPISLAKDPGTELLYDQGGVEIFRIKDAAAP